MCMENKWQSGIFGIAAGVHGHGILSMPDGSQADGSMTSAAPTSPVKAGNASLAAMADRFADRLKSGDISTCSAHTEYDTGSNALVRIMPTCLLCYEQEQSGKLDRKAAIEAVHAAAALTHAHLRSKIACGLYYFMVAAILDATADASLIDLLQRGVTEGWKFYALQNTDPSELAHYSHLLDLRYFAALDKSAIPSTGYVVHALEAAIWSLTTTDNYVDCTLRAVDLGSDNSSAAAIAGGLAGLYYGVEDIPSGWLQSIAQKDWICTMCEHMV